MSFRAIVLGSGTILPSAGRRSTSIFVEAGDTRMLLDCGPGSLDALEEFALSWRSIEVILLTHYHPDHALDIGRLLAARNADTDKSSRSRIKVCGPSGLQAFIERWQALFPSMVPKQDYLEIHEIDAGRIECIDEAVYACRTAHGSSPSLAYYVERNGKRLVYTGDTGWSDELVVFAREADLLLAECSFPDSSGIAGHLTPSTVGKLAARAGARRLILVHLYPVHGSENPASRASKFFTGPIETAYDGLEIVLEY